MTAEGVYWYTYVLFVAMLYLSLARLGRLKELHHGYYGAVLAALPWGPARLVGLVLMADDLYQHWTQAFDVEDGRAPRADFSPIHRLYVWGYHKLLG